MRREKENSRKEETIQIIVNYSWFWSTLEIYSEDLPTEENQNLKSITKEEEKSIVKRVRKDKLEKIRSEIDSTEIKEVCKISVQKERYRKDFLELVELLLSEIEK